MFCKLPEFESLRILLFRCQILWHLYQPDTFFPKFLITFYSAILFSSKVSRIFNAFYQEISNFAYQTLDKKAIAFHVSFLSSLDVRKLKMSLRISLPFQIHIAHLFIHFTIDFEILRSQSQTAQNRLRRWEHYFRRFFGKWTFAIIWCSCLASLNNRQNWLAVIGEVWVRMTHGICENFFKSLIFCNNLTKFNYNVPNIILCSAKHEPNIILCSEKTQQNITQISNFILIFHFFQKKNC